MNTLLSQIQTNLDQLGQLLNEEKTCLIELRYEDLLRVVNRKRSIQAAIEADLLRLGAQSPAPTSDEARSLERLRTVAAQVFEQGRSNQRLARTSIQVVDSLRKILGHCVFGNRGYDRAGISVRPSTQPVLCESA